MTSPPTPPKGAAHSLHRGELGIRRWIRRLRRPAGFSVSMARHSWSLSDGAGIAGSSSVGVSRDTGASFLPRAVA